MSALPLVFHRSAEGDEPFIGKFDERLDLVNCQKPLKMFLQEEALIEEPIDEGARDSEYYKRRRQKRKQMKTNSSLVLEDSTPRDPKGPPKGLKYEGKLANLNLFESIPGQAAPFTYKQKAKSTTDAPFKYVILQPQKVVSEVDGKERTQILVTPVGDWFSFRKPSVTGNYYISVYTIYH